MNHIIYSKRIAAGMVGGIPECDDDPLLNMPVFPTGTREEMIEYGRHTTLASVPDRNPSVCKPNPGKTKGNKED